MDKSPDSNHNVCENLIKEIEKAIREVELSEKAFQWADNNTDAVDLAITRRQAAVEKLDFLIKQAKEMGTSLNLDQFIAKIVEIYK